MPRQMSDLELYAGASQYQQLLDFAAFLGENIHMISTDPNGHVLRFLLYLHGFNESEMAQILEYHKENPEYVKMPALHPSEDVPQFEISSVAMQVRLLFGFAAQFTMAALDAVRVFLKDHHGYSAEEWESVEAFLEAQEANW